MAEVNNNEKTEEGYKSSFAVFSELEGMSEEELKVRKDAIDSIQAKKGGKKGEYFEEYENLSEDELEAKRQELNVYLKVRRPLKEAERVMEAAKNSKRKKLKEAKSQEAEKQKAEEELQDLEKEQKELEEYFEARKREQEETGEIDIDVTAYEEKKDRYDEILDNKKAISEKISETEEKINDIKADIKAKEDRSIRRARRATIFMITRTNWGIVEQMTDTQLMNNVKGVREENKKDQEEKKEQQEPKDTKKENKQKGNLQNGYFGYEQVAPAPEPAKKTEPEPKPEAKPKNKEEQEEENEQKSEKMTLRKRIASFFKARRLAKLEREADFVKQFKEKNDRELNGRERFFAKHTGIAKAVSFFQNLLPSKSKIEPEVATQEIPSCRQMHKEFEADMKGLNRTGDNENVPTPVVSKENGNVQNTPQPEVTVVMPVVPVQSSNGER